MLINKGELFRRTLTIMLMICCSVSVFAVDTTKTKSVQTTKAVKKAKQTSSADKNFLGMIKVQTNSSKQDKKAEDDVYLKMSIDE